MLPLWSNGVVMGGKIPCSFMGTTSITRRLPGLPERCRRPAQGVEFRLMHGEWMYCRVIVLAALSCAAVTAQTAAVEFNRDIRPILSDKCYTCHGPDESKRKSKLRLDTETGAKSDLG